MLNSLYLWLILVVFSMLWAKPSGAQVWPDLNQRAMHLYNQGKYDSSIVVGKKALERAEKDYGAEHINYLHTLNNLAYTYRSMGNLEKSISHFRHVLSSLEPLKNRYYQDYIEAHINLGDTYCLQGWFDSCEYYLSRADEVNDIAQLSGSQVDEKQIDNLQLKIDNSLATLYGYRGQSLKAVEKYREQVNRLESKSEKSYDDSVQLNVLVNNLGTALTRLEKYDEAEIYLRRSLELQENLQQQGSHAYLKTLNNLSGIYTGRADKAKQLLTEAIEKIGARYGKQNELYLIMLNNLGEAYLEEEDYARAEQLLEESYNIQKRGFSKHSRLYQHTLFNLAETYHWQLKLDRGEALYKIIQDNILAAVTHNFTYLNESEKRSFYLNHLYLIEGFELFALTRSGAVPFMNPPREMIDPHILGDLIDLRLATKGIVLNATSRMRRRILSSEDPELIEKYNFWESKKNQLANAYTSAVIDQPGEFEELKAGTEKLEKELAIMSGDFRKGFEMEQVSWKEIQQRLKPGEAAVEMIRYFDGLIYGALVITPKTREHPVLAIIESTKSKHLERAFFRYFKNNILYKTKDTISYRRYWQPIRDTIMSYTHSREIKKIYFAPDGIYHQISLNSLPDPQTNQYLLDEIELVQVNNLKELITDEVDRGSDGTPSALLVGRPAFSPSDVEDASNNEQIRSGRTNFTDLKATEKEVITIGELLEAKDWNSKIYLGKEASESKIRNIEQYPEVVHFATHGYFNTGRKGADYSREASVIDYMLQSGIVLAGANLHNDQFEGEDGILTSLEVSNLDLDKTELVVLSACETGLGKTESREGVYGLQRALKIAGAECILMSLWKVDDQATQELMTAFYRSYLSHRNKRKAFRKAQSELRKKYPEPYYWGAFVMLGAD